MFYLISNFFYSGEMRNMYFILESNFTRNKKKKNLWRRKCVRRAMFQTVEVRVTEVFAPFNLYFVCNTAAGSLCDL